VPHCEEAGLLADNGHVTAQPVEVQLLDVCPVNQHLQEHVLSALAVASMLLQVRGDRMFMHAMSSTNSEATQVDVPDEDCTNEQAGGEVYVCALLGQPVGRRNAG